MTALDMVATQAEVERRMRHGDRFEEVEEWINGLPVLSEEEKSALWLLAWSYVGWRRQRRVAREHASVLRMLREAGPEPLPEPI